jgi:hypothetical protein
METADVAHRRHPGLSVGMASATLYGFVERLIQSFG